MSSLENFIWYEKYRPKDLGSLVLEQDTHQLLHSYIEKQDIPHLLFYGRPGSGKTTLSQMLCAALPCSHITLNASGEERSIETMRTTVPQFAGSMPTKGTKLKIVFFDEADGITPQAQAALKNTMETYSRSCRFILTANNVNKIIEPIRSRCTEIPLLQFSKEDAVQLCVTVLQKENVAHTEQDVRSVVDRHYPDMRSTMNTLQRASSGGKLNPKGLGATEAELNAVMTCITGGTVKTLRGMTVNMTDYMNLYTGLFDNIDSIFTAQQVPDAARCLCDHLFYETTIPDREINFVTLCVEWMALRGTVPNFNK